MNSMDSSIKKILIIGLGAIGMRHLKIIKKLFPKIKIIALRHQPCDQEEADSLGLDDCVDNIEKALEFNPDAAIISNPSTMRLELINLLAEKGVHLFIEKPISASSEGIQELIDLCNHKGIVLMTGYNLRFLPSLVEFRKELDKGKIGNILSFQAEVGQNLSKWRPNKHYKKTVSSQKRLGGGVLLELSHEIDYINWIFGKIGWVKSHVSNQSELEIDVEDNANIIFGFKRQKNYEIIGLLNMNFYQYDISRKCKVIGEKGTLLWDGVAGEVKFYGEKAERWKTVFSSCPDRDFTYIEEIKNFFTSIENNKKPHISGNDGLDVLKVIDAIRQSNLQGNVVYL